MEPLLRGQGTEALHDVFHHRAKLHPVHLPDDLAPFDPGGIEEVVDQVQQLFNSDAAAGEHLPLAVPERPDVVAEDHLEVALYRGQRGFQIMGGHSQKVGAEPVELDQPAVGLLQLLHIQEASIL